MPSSIEDLPVELWFIIFSFLEGHDLQRAFVHLNSFITALLNSPRLQVYLNIKTGGCKELSSSHILFCPEAFKALHANIHGTSDLLTFLNVNRTLTNLCSLSLHIRGQKNYHLLISILPRFTCLQHLAISCGMYSADHAMVSLNAEILKLPILRMCELRLSQAAFSCMPLRLHPDSPISGSLRRFHMDAWISSVDLCHLVEFMPSLRFLNFYLYHHNMSSWNDLSLPQLTKRASLSLIRHHIDLEHLSKVVPNLKCFNLQIEPYKGQFTNEFFKAQGFINSKINRVHVQMTLKKNINSSSLELLPPVIIQRQKLPEEILDEGQDQHKYFIINKYFEFT